MSRCSPDSLPKNLAGNQARGAWAPRSVTRLSLPPRARRPKKTAGSRHTVRVIIRVSLRALHIRLAKGCSAVRLARAVPRKFFSGRPPGGNCRAARPGSRFGRSSRPLPGTPDGIYSNCQKFFLLWHMHYEPKSPLPPLFQRGELRGELINTPEVRGGGGRTARTCSRASPPGNCSPAAGRQRFFLALPVLGDRLSIL